MVLFYLKHRPANCGPGAKHSLLPSSVNRLTVAQKLPFIDTLSTAALVLQKQTWVVVTKTVYLTKLNLFII